MADADMPHPAMPPQKPQNSADDHQPELAFVSTVASAAAAGGGGGCGVADGGAGVPLLVDNPDKRRIITVTRNERFNMKFAV